MAASDHNDETFSDGRSLPMRARIGEPTSFLRGPHSEDMEVVVQALLMSTPGEEADYDPPVRCVFARGCCLVEAL